MVLIKQTSKLIFLIFGWISLALGILGAFLPLLPTTPFALLAAYCFSKGSPRLYAWLLKLPKIGDAIYQWNEHGVIRPRVKWLSLFMISFVIVSIIINGTIPLGVKVFVPVTLAFVIIFIFSRPSRPQGQQG